MSGTNTTILQRPYKIKFCFYQSIQSKNVTCHTLHSHKFSPSADPPLTLKSGLIEALYSPYTDLIETLYRLIPISYSQYGHYTLICHPFHIHF